MAIDIGNYPDVDAYNVINIHQPVQFEVFIYEAGSLPNSNMTITFDGITPAIDTKSYEFNMLHNRSVWHSASSTYIIYFRFDAQKVLEAIANRPIIYNELSGDQSMFMHNIDITINYPGHPDLVYNFTIARGCNQYPNGRQASNIFYGEQFDGSSTEYINRFVGRPFYVYINNDFGSVSVGYKILDHLGSILYSTTLATATLVGNRCYYIENWQIMSAIWASYDVSKNPNYKLVITDATNPDFGEIPLVLIPSECDPIVLMWVDRNGSVIQYPFNGYRTETLSRKEVGKGILNFPWTISEENQGDKNQVIGYEDAHKVISIVEKIVKPEYYEMMEDLFISNSVYLYTGNQITSYQEQNWEQVRVNGSWIEKTKRSLQSMSFTIQRQNQYTPSL